MAPRSLNRCCIVGCTSTITTTRLYFFPRERSLRSKWIRVIEERTPAGGPKLNHGSRMKKVCKLHFEDKAIQADGSRKRFAIPNLFSEEEILTKVPSKAYTVALGDMLCPRYSRDPDTESERREIDDELSPSVDVLPTIGSKYRHHGIGNETPQVLMVSYPDNEVSDAVPSRSVNIPSTVSSEYRHQVSIGNMLSQELTVSHPANGEEASNTVAPAARVQTPTSNPNEGPKAKRNRLFKSVKALTPRCKRIYEECQRIIKSKRRLCYTFQERLQKAQELCEKQSFDTMMKSLPPSARTLINMQVTQANKHIKMRRFNTEAKLLSLTIMKQSPKCYKTLAKLFILPSRRTLTKFTQEFLMNPGLNSNVLAQLKQSVKNWTPTKKICSIVFDEVSLTSALTPIESEDKVVGFVHLDQGPIKRFADHALVFMVRGIVSNWRQQIAFYFSEGTVPAPTLKNILRDVVEALFDTGLTPIALVCDQGSTFQTCLKSFKEDTRRECIINEELEDNKIIISGHKLNMVYDPPHLIKGVRNNLLNKDISFCGKIARWSDIIEVYLADCRLGGIRMLHKLTDEHVIPDKIPKMKVKNATQALSERTSALLRYSSNYGQYADGTPVSKTLRDTGDAVLFFDKLFDSVNGSRGGNAPHKMRGPVKEVKGTTPHVTFWKEAIATLENTFYFETTPDGNLKKKYVPSLQNWVTTLKSFIDIWSELQRSGVKYFYTRKLNQDPLENFFGRIRALNHRNTKPDCYSFQCAFKSLLITNVLGPHSPHANCEDDVGALLFTLNRSDAARSSVSGSPEAAASMVESTVTAAAASTPTSAAAAAAAESAAVASTSSEVAQAPSSTPTSGPGEALLLCQARSSVAGPSTAAMSRLQAAAPSSSGVTHTSSSSSGPDRASLLHQVRTEKTSVHADAYAAGYVMKKLIAKFKCQICKRSFSSKDPSDLHTWITERERRRDSRSLNYTNSAFTMLFRNLVGVVTKYLDKNVHLPNVFENIKLEFLQKANVDWFGCSQHHTEILNNFLSLVIRIQVHNFCNTVNKITKGAFSAERINTSLEMHNLALKKYNKYHRK